MPYAIIVTKCWERCDFLWEEEFILSPDLKRYSSLCLGNLKRLVAMAEKYVTLRWIRKQSREVNVGASFLLFLIQGWPSSFS